MLKKFVISKNITYLCTAKLAGSAGPFVYRLGRKIFILERAVRFRYGLLFFMYNIKQNFS